MEPFKDATSSGTFVPSTGTFLVILKVWRVIVEPLC